MQEKKSFKHVELLLERVVREKNATVSPSSVWQEQVMHRVRAHARTPVRESDVSANYFVRTVFRTVGVGACCVALGLALYNWHMTQALQQQISTLALNATFDTGYMNYFTL